MLEALSEYLPQSHTVHSLVLGGDISDEDAMIGFSEDFKRYKTICAISAL